MFAEVEQVVVPVTLTPNWWNIELATNKGDEIVGMLRRFYGRPLVSGPYSDEFARMLFGALSKINVHPETLRFVQFKHVADVLVRRAIKTSFSKMLTEFAERNCRKEMRHFSDPLREKLMLVWQELQKSWGSHFTKMDAIQIAVHLGLWRLLYNAILFIVCERRDLMASHRIFLDLYERGNFPIGELKSASGAKRFLVHMAVPRNQSS